MRVLLDTCVISELQRPDAHPAVRARVDALDAAGLYLSAITIGELVKGIALLPPGNRKERLSIWLEGIEQRFSDRILPIDSEVAHLWGQITARAQSSGVQIPASEGLIAATALRYGLEVMTRNSRHFAASGAVIIDPWLTGEESRNQR